MEHTYQIKFISTVTHFQQVRAGHGGGRFLNTDKNVEARCHLGLIRMETVAEDEFPDMTGFFLS